MSKNEVDPRARMKEVRAYVKGFMKGENPDDLEHLGEYPQNMDDAVRVIIALQDALDESKKRHRRATDRVLDANTKLKQLAGMTAVIMESAWNIHAAQQEKIQEVCEENQQLGGERRDMIDHILGLEKKLEDREMRLAAAMVTIQTSMMEDEF